MRFAPTPLMLGLLCALSATSALASGYHFGSQSASAQGTANANAAEDSGQLYEQRLEGLSSPQAKHAL